MPRPPSSSSLTICLRSLPGPANTTPLPTSNSSCYSAIYALRAVTRRNMSSTQSRKALNVGNINQNVCRAKYAVRGELAVRSEKYREKLSKDRPPTPNTGESQEEALPFDSVIAANIGNPQQLEQKPFTFFRQVTSLLENPTLMEKEDVLIDHLGYKQDVIDRARLLLRDCTSVGAYSQSQGLPVVRRSVARFIEQRDGHLSNPNDIFLSAGASAGVGTLLNIICNNPTVGVMIPIPQYPLYSASLSLFNANAVPYNLAEEAAWGTKLDVIRAAHSKAKADGVATRAIAVINPGNPTGAVLRKEDIRSLLEFAAEEHLVVIADEVYQSNVFQGEFISFKKVLRELQQETPGKFDDLELASLHSISKGMVGECGHRGGYMELVGFDQEVVAQIYKFVSISLCPPVIGQCLVECMVNPPKDGDPSYPLYKEEYESIYDGLKQRADALYEAFTEMEGVECQRPMGAMYLFPTIKLPQKSLEAAKHENRAPDEFYVSKLLDATGICMVPGSGFGQKEGTMHFRTTFLPPGTEWVGRIRKFHDDFMQQYQD